MAEMMKSRRAVFAVLALGATVSTTATVCGQFNSPVTTNVRERVAGTVLTGEEGPTPEAGDEIGAFFGNTVVGRYVLGSGSGPANQFSIIVYGDNLTTGTVVEGPRSGQAVTFRFFDNSRNTVLTNVRVENTDGEPFNYVYAGAELPPIDLPVPIDLTPTRNLNLRVGVAPSNGGNNGGEDGLRGDVNGDGKVNSEDAALILRAVISGQTTVSSTATSATGTNATSSNGTNTQGNSDTDNTDTDTTTTTTTSTTLNLDVNGDGVVSTADAIEVLRAR